jgi:hypothetical protein
MPEEGSPKSQLEAREHDLHKSVAREEVRPNKTAHP